MKEEKLITNSFTVLKMTCMGCVSRVESALSALEGVTSAKATIEEETVEIEYNPDIVSPQDFYDTVTKAGYEFQLEENKKDNYISNTFTVLQMTCMHCVGRVEKALKELEGVESVEISLENNSATISYNPSKITPIDFKNAVTQAGYEFVLDQDEHASSSDELTSETFTVLQMTCMHCVGRVEKALKAIDGVSNVDVDLESESVNIEFNPNKATLDDFAKAVTDAGYKYVGKTNPKDNNNSSATEESEEEQKKNSNSIVKENFPVLKMTCAGCATGVEKKLNSIEGVKFASVNFANESSQIEYDSNQTNPEEIRKAVQEIGYDLYLNEKKAENQSKSNFPVLNMTCAACATGVENKIKSIPGVKFASVNFATQSLQVDFETDKVQAKDMQKALQDIGYDLMIEDNESQTTTLEEIHEKRHKELKHRTTWAIILATPVMIIGMFFMNIPYANLIMWILSTPVVLWLGRDFFINAWKQAKYRTANMDTLVALSTGIAYLFSVFNMIFPQFWESKGLEAHVYFEAAAVIIAFILIGRLLEEKAKGNTSTALKKLMGLQPKTVVIVKDNEHIEIPIEEINVGDIVLVKPGEKIAVDGTLISGESFVDESMLSGEPMAIRKSEGDKVFAGTINQKGSFRFKANKVGKDTMLAQIIKMVQDAQGSKAPVQQLVDKIAAIFVPIVIGIAILTFIIWMTLGGDNALTHALLAFVTVLIIACPCALGLATPTAIMVGIGKGAEEGILIKDAESLETSKNINAVVLDKTGTITEGKPQVTEELWLDNSSKAILAGMEKQSEHPLADAIVEHLKDENSISLDSFESITGKGIVGSVAGAKYIAGNKKLLSENNIPLPGDIEAKADDWSNSGKTVIWFANSTKVLAILAISDRIKETSLEAINQLHQMGIELYMLTGDNISTSKAIAKQAGIDHFKAEVLPQDKAEFVKSLQHRGKIVAMVGDGINDSAALAQADVSIAMGQGSDIAMDVAKMTIISSDLTKIPKAIKLSKQTVKTIRQNLFWAFIYNVIGIPIAAGILYPINGFLLNPMIAGAAMAFSSVSVVSNSLRLKIKKI